MPMMGQSPAREVPGTWSQVGWGANSETGSGQVGGGSVPAEVPREGNRTHDVHCTITAKLKVGETAYQ